MKGISQELNEIIKQEVLSHQVNERKDAIKEERRIIARHKIEDILAAKQLEASLELSL
jgi:hypothetical protein